MAQSGTETVWIRLVQVLCDSDLYLYHRSQISKIQYKYYVNHISTVMDQFDTSAHFWLITVNESNDLQNSF